MFSMKRNETEVREIIITTQWQDLKSIPFSNMTGFRSRVQFGIEGMFSLGLGCIWQDYIYNVLLCNYCLVEV